MDNSQTFILNLNLCTREIVHCKINIRFGIDESESKHKKYQQMFNCLI